MESKFFTFIKPYLSYIDDGHFFRKPFVWLYTLIAVLNLLFPLAIFFQASQSNIFDGPAKVIVVFLITWLAMAFAGWVSFQLWWDRKSKISLTSTAGDEFVATGVFSHFIQTFGEWSGTFVGFIGFYFALFATLILGDEARYLVYSLEIPFLETGWAAVITMPVTGFFIVVISRFVAEQIRAFAAIANNTKKL